MLPFCNDPKKSMDEAVPDDLLISSSSQLVPTTSTEVKHDKRSQLNPDIPLFNMNATPQNSVSEEQCDSNSGTGADTNNAEDQPTTTSPFLSTQQSNTA